MPLNTKIVGQQTKIFEHHVDARWLMAYAAGINDTHDCYMNTEARRDVIAHPVFPVCLEWPVILNARMLDGADSMSQEENARGVHASHDLHIHKPIRAGDTLSTRGKIIGVKKIRPGAAQYIRLDTKNQNGELVCSTYQITISRGVDVLGENNFIEEPPRLPKLLSSNEEEKLEISVSAGAANVYTETAKIFNPIHTDRSVALAAGLPDIILHGTATLAMAISRLIHQYTDGHPERVTRLGGRFSTMVLMPSRLTLVVHSSTASQVDYSVLTEDGKVAISNGFFCVNS